MSYELGDSVLVGYRRYDYQDFTGFRRGVITGISDTAIRVEFANFKLFRRRIAWVNTKSETVSISKIKY